MLQNIPTHVIAGPLGAGKTSLIKHLLTQKPASERWAILINEFGLIGLDAALLTTAADGIALGEVAGGCLCCVNGAPFQIGLGRLLRKARPDRLFIEPSGLGHPVQLLAQLREAPWIGVLAVQPSIVVLDAQALASGKALSQTQEEATAEAGLLVLNKSSELNQAQRQTLVERLPSGTLHWTDSGVLMLDQLPGIDAQGTEGGDNFVAPKTLAELPPVWIDQLKPICLSQRQPEGWSIGWRWHPDRVFDAEQIGKWLLGQAWRRAKLVIHSRTGWLSGNALDSGEMVWKPSEWRRDSRLELIFAEPQDEGQLSVQFAACLVQST